MAIIVYFILYTVNMIPNVHIPLDNTVLNNVMQMIGILIWILKNVMKCWY